MRTKMRLHYIIAALTILALSTATCSQFPFRPHRATATPVPPTDTPSSPTKPRAATIAAQAAPTNTPTPKPELTLKYGEFAEAGFGIKHPQSWEAMRNINAPEVVFAPEKGAPHLRVVVTALSEGTTPDAVPTLLEQELKEISSAHPDMRMEKTAGMVRAAGVTGQFQSYVIEQNGVKVRYRLAVLADENSRSYRVLTSAPADEFADYANVYEEMLNSFRSIGEPPTTTAAALPLVKYEGEDFAIVYPGGWGVYPNATRPEILIAPTPPTLEEAQSTLGVVIRRLGKGQVAPDILLNDYYAARKSDGFVRAGSREAVKAVGATGSLEHYHEMRGVPLHYTVSFLTGPDGQTYQVTQYCPLEEYTRYAETFKEMRYSFAPVGGAKPGGITSAGYCDNITPPALLVAARDGYPATLRLMSPDGEVTCNLPLQQTPMDEFHTATGTIYYKRRDDNDAAVVVRIAPDGTSETLNFTASAPRLASYSFLVSPDGVRIAWAMAAELPSAEARLIPQRFTHDVYVADVDGSNQIKVLNDVPLGEGQVLRPVKFSADGTGLILAAHQPLDISSPIAHSWSSLLRVRFDAPNQLEQIFNCGAGNPACIHDLSPDERFLVYRNATGRMVFRAVDGSTEMAIADAPAGSYGKFSPSGADFVFYRTGDVAALVSHPPEPVATSTILTAGPRLVPFVAWVDDDTRLVFSLMDNAGDRTYRLLDLHTGAVTPLALDGEILAILR